MCIRDRDTARRPADRPGAAAGRPTGLPRPGPRRRRRPGGGTPGRPAPGRRARSRSCRGSRRRCARARRGAGRRSTRRRRRRSAGRRPGPGCPARSRACWWPEGRSDRWCAGLAGRHGCRRGSAPTSRCPSRAAAAPRSAAQAVRAWLPVRSCRSASCRLPLPPECCGILPQPSAEGTPKGRARADGPSTAVRRPPCGPSLHHPQPAYTCPADFGGAGPKPGEIASALCRFPDTWASQTPIALDV